MGDLVFKAADEEVPRDRLALLLEHFSSSRTSASFGGPVANFLGLTGWL